MRQTEEPRTGTGRPGRSTRRSRIAAGVAVGLVAVGVGGTAIATATAGQAPPPIERRSETVATEQSLGDVTLDHLADQLNELGLTLTISPTDGSAASAAGGSAAEDRADGGQDDPFAGMTDAEIDALSDEEFSTILQQAGWIVDGVPDGAGQDGEYGAADSEKPLASFTVTGDRIEGTDAAPEYTAKAEKIWQRFVELIPADQRQMVVGFELLNEDFGGAYVYPTDDDPTKWVLGVDAAADSDPADLDYTLVHEFGHLLTLQAGQVPPGGDESSCTTYYTGEGCALSRSTFARFVERFWPPSMIAEADQAEAAMDAEGASAFYERHRDEFVTDYAATNPGEDLAETFATFVTQDRPSGGTIADQKVQFLWDDPAMVALRSQIRENMKQLAPTG